MKQNKEMTTVYLFRPKIYREIPTNEFKAFLVENNYSISACGVLFDQSKQKVFVQNSLIILYDVNLLKMKQGSRNRIRING